MLFNKYISQIKNENQDLKIYTYITPVSKVRLKRYLQIVNKGDINRFYKDIAKISNNKPINFLLDKNINNKIQPYFMDTHHLTPNGCDILIRKI